MAYQVVDRNSGLFEKTATDEFNVVIQEIDEKIDNWSNKDKDYKFNDVHPVIIENASRNLSFGYGHKIVLNFSWYNVNSNYYGEIDLKCSELKKVGCKFLLTGYNDNNDIAYLLCDDGKFSIPYATDSGNYHFYSIVVW